MPGSSTDSFTDADEFRARFAGKFAEFTLISPGAFVAHVNRTELRYMHLFQVRESLARVAYVALPSDLVFVSFSADPKSFLVWRGIALEPDEIMLHACGEHLHQRTDGRSLWGLIALSPAALADACKTETGGGLPLPRVGRIIRPPPRDWQWLLRVHRQAARLAETRPAILSHPEVIRAMENELAGLLIRCLTEGEVRADSARMLHAADVMQRFESALAQCSQRNPTALELSVLLGVSSRTLHKHCAAFLGVSPRRYMQLRQSSLALAQPARAVGDPQTGSAE